MLFPNDARSANKSLIRMVDAEMNKPPKKRMVRKPPKVHGQQSKIQPSTTFNGELSKKKISIPLELPKLPQQLNLRSSNSSKNRANIHGFAKKDYTDNLASVSPSDESNGSLDRDAPSPINVSPASDPNNSPSHSNDPTPTSPENSDNETGTRELLQLPHLQYNVHSVPSIPKSNHRHKNKSHHTLIINPSLKPANTLPNPSTTNTRLSQVNSIKNNIIILTLDTRLSRMKHIDENAKV